MTKTATNIPMAPQKNQRKKQSALFVVVAGLALALMAAPYLAPGADAALDDGGFCIQAVSDQGEFEGLSGPKGCSSLPALEECETTAATLTKVSKLRDDARKAAANASPVAALSPVIKPQSVPAPTISYTRGSASPLVLNVDSAAAASAICSGGDALSAVSMDLSYSATASITVDGNTIATTVYDIRLTGPLAAPISSSVVARTISGVGASTPNYAQKSSAQRAELQAGAAPAVLMEIRRAMAA
jgi:hypothetical protein